MLILAAFASGSNGPEASVDDAGECSCTDFCSGQCAFNPKPKKPNASLLQRATKSGPFLEAVYRFTPQGVVELSGKNTGDAAGDLAFFLSRRALTERCAIEPGDLRCFLAPVHTLCK